MTEGADPGLGRGGPSLPSAWVVRFAGMVPSASEVLDIACGAGRHSRFFLGRGHPVTAVDIDLSGLAGLGGQKGLSLVQADLEKGPWPLPGRCFGAVVVVNFLWRPLFPVLIDSVEPGGVLLYDTFALGQERFGRPANPEHLLRPGELLEAVRGRLTVRAYEHGETAEPAPSIRQRLCAYR
jgi:SAM-dependent methyltransferase